MSTQTQALIVTTAAELARMPDDDFRYELDEGELIRMPPPGEEHGRVDARLHGLLFQHADKHGLGNTYTNTAFFSSATPTSSAPPTSPSSASSVSRSLWTVAPATSWAPRTWL